MAMARESKLICMTRNSALIAAALCCFAASVDADDLFVVRSISVDSEADDANAARALALAEGQERAFGLLLKKLTLDSDHGRLPTIESIEISNFVQGFEVANERRSERRYLADITVRFKPQAVRALLLGAHIPFAESVSSPIVVLPIFQSAGAIKLWDDPNPWREAWRHFELREGLVDLVVPIGELTDLTAINSSQALDGNRLALRNFAAGHGADESLVAVANLAFDPNGTPVVDVTVQRYGAIVGPLLVERLMGEPAGSIEDLLGESVSKMAARIEHDWKYENLLEFDEKQDIQIDVPIEDLAHWLKLNSELSKLPVIREANILSLSLRKAVVHVHYLGSIGRLSNVLAQRGMDLLSSDGRWMLTAQDNFGVGAAGAPQTSETEDISDSRTVEELPALEDQEIADPPAAINGPAPLDDLLVE